LREKKIHIETCFPVKENTPCVYSH